MKMQFYSFTMTVDCASELQNALILYSIFPITLSSAHTHHTAFMQIYFSVCHPMYETGYMQSTTIENCTSKLTSTYLWIDASKFTKSIA